MKQILLLWLVGYSALHAAAFEFLETHKDLHAPADAKTVTVEFPFTNKSDKPHTVKKSDSGCSCLKVEISDGKLKYEPGESGVVRATFDMGNFSGSVDKMIALWIDDDAPDKPSTRLSVKVHIPVLVGVEPKTVKWDIGEKPESKTVQVTMAEGKPIRVLSVNSSSESFVYELKTLEEGKRYSIIITPRLTTAPGLAVLRIETDCEISKHKVQQAFAVVRKSSPADRIPQRP